MRGKGTNQEIAFNHLRITPAYAGKRDFLPDSQSRKEDHPRLCGEKALMLIGIILGLGSPPPMRGKADSEAAQKEFQRITPAYAGKSFHGHSQENTPTDHPRLCGEKFARMMNGQTPIGSPPPMRGKANFMDPVCV